MRPLFYLSENQLERIKPFFAHGVPCVDDRRVAGDVIGHGFQWKAAPDKYGPRKTLCSQLVEQAWCFQQDFC